MPYIAIDVTMPSGPKFSGAPSSAGWLHVCAMAWSGLAKTDGFIPRAQVYRLTNDPPRVINAAVKFLTTVQPGCDHPLWIEADGGWSIHDYLDPRYGNPSRANPSGGRLVEGSDPIKRMAGEAGGRRSVEVRRLRFGSAQPRSSPKATPKQPALKQPRSNSEACFEPASNPITNTNTNTNTNGSEPTAPHLRCLEPPVPTEPPVLSNMSPALSAAESDSIEAELWRQAEQLCQALADRVATYARRPVVTAAWRADARLLLSRDERPFEEALELIDWATQDSFWRRNVLSMAKFRTQYDRLRLQRQDESVVALRPGKTRAPTKTAEAIALSRHYDELADRRAKEGLL